MVTLAGALSIELVRDDDQAGWSGYIQGDDHTRGDGTGLNTTDGHRSNTTDLVNILEGKTEGL